MKATLSIAATAMMLAFSPASADYFSAKANDGQVSFSDRPLDHAMGTTRITGDTVTVPQRSELTGTWTAQGDDGRYINFRIDANGKYVFDERNHNTPARLYMCGRLHTTSDSLELSVMARKQMQASGVTTESRDAGTVQFEVVSARSDRLVLDVEGSKLVFFRS